jgi:hypothetical protein
MNGFHISTSCDIAIPFAWEHFENIQIAWAICESKICKIGIM